MTALLRADRDALCARLEAAHIACLDRFSTVAELRSVLDARESTNDPRPLAIVCATRADWNGAFGFMGEHVEVLENEYRVVYVEADSDAEAVQAIRDAARGTPVAMLMLGGHGDPTGMAFGNGDGDSDRLDEGDTAEMTALRAMLVPDATVLNLSCSNARGGTESFAAEEARVTGARVIAVAQPSNGHFVSGGGAPLGRELNWAFLDACTEFRPAGAHIDRPTACGVTIVRPR